MGKTNCSVSKTAGNKSVQKTRVNDLTVVALQTSKTKGTSVMTFTDRRSICQNRKDNIQNDSTTDTERLRLDLSKLRFRSEYPESASPPVRNEEPMTSARIRSEVTRGLPTVKSARVDRSSSWMKNHSSWQTSEPYLTSRDWDTRDEVHTRPNAPCFDKVRVSKSNWIRNCETKMNIYAANESHKSTLRDEKRVEQKCTQLQNYNFRLKNILNGKETRKRPLQGPPGIAPKTSIFQSNVIFG